MPMRTLAALALAAMTLAGCDSDKAEVETASGDILPGRASDAMIPLDQVKSQAPQAAPVEVVPSAEAKAGPAFKNEADAEIATEEQAVEPAADQTAPAEPEAPAAKAE